MLAHFDAHDSLTKQVFAVRCLSTTLGTGALTLMVAWADEVDRYAFNFWASRSQNIGLHAHVSYQGMSLEG